MDWRWPWGQVLALLDEAGPDIRLINLEATITADGEFADRKPVCYRMHPDNLSALTALRPEFDGACGGSADATACAACCAAADSVSAGGSSNACDGDPGAHVAGCGAFGGCGGAGSCAGPGGVCYPGSAVGGPGRDWVCGAGGVGAAAHGGSGTAAAVRVRSTLVLACGVIGAGIDNKQ